MHILVLFSRGEKGKYMYIEDIEDERVFSQGYIEEKLLYIWDT